MFPRIVANLLLLFSILYLPWWIFPILLVAGFFVFKRFYEALLWALAADLLYGTGIAALYGFWFLMSAGAVILFLGIEKFKQGIRYYN